MQILHVIWEWYIAIGKIIAIGGILLFAGAILLDEVRINGFKNTIGWWILGVGILAILIAVFWLPILLILLYVISLIARGDEEEFHTGCS